MWPFFCTVGMLAAIGAWRTSAWVCAGRGIWPKLGVGLLMFCWLQAFVIAMVWQFRTGAKLPRIADFALSLSLPWLVWTFCLFVLMDALRLVRILPSGSTARRVAGAAALLAMAALTAYGAWNASRPRITRHQLEMPRISKPLRVVLVSDLHLGAPGSRVSFFQRTADLVESLAPDLMLIPGDVIDWDDAPLGDATLMAQVGRLKGKFGTYVCEGNHDLYAGRLRQVCASIERLGMVFLADRATAIDTPAGPVAIAGRLWPEERRHIPAPQRKTVPELFSNAPPDALRIVLDHTPKYYQEAIGAADLQVSGHTHSGQFFPASLVTRLLYDNAWGLLTTNGLAQVTTCGLSTWSAPVRVATYPEIVCLDLVPAPHAAP